MATTDMRSLAEKFDKNGYVSGLDILTDKEVLELRANFDHVQEDIGEHISRLCHCFVYARLVLILSHVGCPVLSSNVLC